MAILSIDLLLKHSCLNLLTSTTLPSTSTNWSSTQCPSVLTELAFTQHSQTNSLASVHLQNSHRKNSGVLTYTLWTFTAKRFISVPALSFVLPPGMLVLLLAFPYSSYLLWRTGISSSSPINVVHSTYFLLSKTQFNQYRQDNWTCLEFLTTSMVYS